MSGRPYSGSQSLPDPGQFLRHHAVDPQQILAHPSIFSSHPHSHMDDCFSIIGMMFMSWMMVAQANDSSDGW